MEKVCFPKDGWPLWDLIGVLTLPNVIRFKAQDGEALVGFIAADQRPKERVAWIATVGVLPEYRRKGIAQALIERVEAEVEMPIVRLCVRISNEGARRLYEKLGYVVHDTWRVYYRDGEDALVMQKARISDTANKL